MSKEGMETAIGALLAAGLFYLVFMTVLLFVCMYFRL